MTSVLQSIALTMKPLASSRSAWYVFSCAGGSCSGASCSAPSRPFQWISTSWAIAGMKAIAMAGMWSRSVSRNACALISRPTNTSTGTSTVSGSRDSNRPTMPEQAPSPMNRPVATV